MTSIPDENNVVKILQKYGMTSIPNKNNEDKKFSNRK